VDPFDQPNVIEAKERTESILSSIKNRTFVWPIPSYEDHEISTYSDNSYKNLTEFLKVDSKYVAIMAYLNKEDDKQFIQLKKLIASKVKKPVTFGWGPRFLHSTGQIHKGGQLNGSFIQITSTPMTTLEIPGQSFDFAELIMAQALGDGMALRECKLPVIRIHLRDRQKAFEKLLKEIESF
jgi:glucose-6-phosphate isomerase